ncbi:MAG: Rpn family recombination-promoting nuclease/putative transposase [Lachnospiraceae bacterium]|nr:Rpn family recombination-promoting nuclease/putative transposase [Lachnospiraceae bacterium]
MPFRVIGYDGASYRDELNHGEERYPVVTFILYYGTTKRWSKNHRSLCDEFKDVPESLKPYVNDYRIHVFEIAWLSEETVARFKSDFRIMADYFVQVRKNGNYVPSREEMKHVNEVLGLMEAMTNSRNFQNAQNESRKGDVKRMSMADWLDQKLDEAKEQGKEQESDRGIDFLLKTCADLGATCDYAVNRIMTDYHLTEEDAKSRVRKYYTVE